MSDIIWQEFQSNEAAKFGVLGLVDNAHAPAAEFFDNAVVRDGLPNELAGCSHRRKCYAATVGGSNTTMIRQLGTGRRVALHWFLGLPIWWSKRLSPKQLQSDDSIEAKFSNFLVHPVYLLNAQDRTAKTKSGREWFCESRSTGLNRTFPLDRKKAFTPDLVK